MASRSHWLTAPMMVITRRPAAEPVSSDSATETSATLRFSNSSSKPHRSLTLRVSRSSLAPGAERDVAHALALTALMLERIAGALSDGLPFPLAHRAHDGNHQASCRRAGVQRFRDRDQRHLALFEQLQQAAQIFDAAREPVQLGHDDRLHFAGVDQRQETLQTRPVKRLGGFAAVDDDVEQFRALDRGHSADFRLLSFNRNAL